MVYRRNLRLGRVTTIYHNCGQFCQQYTIVSLVETDGRNLVCHRWIMCVIQNWPPLPGRHMKISHKNIRLILGQSPTVSYECSQLNVLFVSELHVTNLLDFTYGLVSFSNILLLFSAYSPFLQFGELS